ncbi:NAD(P)-binding domain-containing protein [Streptomyces sp. NPDC127092]|uniref:NAD(P)-binding domain-containing protein n=1 Tax=Streptomyces sp. NPDC127092 TaxID=3347135 RepID=UPI003662A7FC
MATALGGAWVRAGHQVLVGGRNGAATAVAAARTGAAAGDLSEASTWGEAVLMAVPADSAPKLAAEFAAPLAGVGRCSTAPFPWRPARTGPS